MNVLTCHATFLALPRQYDVYVHIMEFLIHFEFVFLQTFLPTELKERMGILINNEILLLYRYVTKSSNKFGIILRNNRVCINFRPYSK